MISRITGRRITREQHLKQSLYDILTTPIDTRLSIKDGDRNYGSRLPYLIGRPLNDETQADAVASTAQAISQWENRIRLNRVQIFSDENQIRISLTDSNGKLIEFNL